MYSWLLEIKAKPSDLLIMFSKKVIMILSFHQQLYLGSKQEIRNVEEPICHTFGSRVAAFAELGRHNDTSQVKYETKSSSLPFLQLSEAVSTAYVEACRGKESLLYFIS